MGQVASANAIERSRVAADFGCRAQHQHPSRALRDASSSKASPFTGGTGKAGRHAIPYLLDLGQEMLGQARTL
jgi:hypothetical protein